MSIIEDVRREGVQPLEVAEAAHDAFKQFFSTVDPERLHYKISNTFLLARLLGGVKIERFFEWEDAETQTASSVMNETRQSGLLNGGLKKEPRNIYVLGQSTIHEGRQTKLAAFVLGPSSSNFPAGFHILKTQVEEDLSARTVADSEINDIVTTAATPPGLNTLAKNIDEVQPLIELLSEANQKAALFNEGI